MCDLNENRWPIVGLPRLLGSSHSLLQIRDILKVLLVSFWCTEGKNRSQGVALYKMDPKEGFVDSKRPAFEPADQLVDQNELKFDTNDLK